MVKRVHHNNIRLYLLFRARDILYTLLSIEIYSMYTIYYVLEYMLLVSGKRRCHVATNTRRRLGIVEIPKFLA